VKEESRFLVCFFDDYLLSKEKRGKRGNSGGVGESESIELRKEIAKRERERDGESCEYVGKYVVRPLLQLSPQFSSLFSSFSHSLLSCLLMVVDLVSQFGFFQV